MKTFPKKRKSTAHECKWSVEDIRYKAFSNLLIDIPKKNLPLIIREGPSFPCKRSGCGDCRYSWC